MGEDIDLSGADPVLDAARGGGEFVEQVGVDGVIGDEVAVRLELLGLLAGRHGHLLWQRCHRERMGPSPYHDGAGAGPPWVRRVFD